jgi:lipid-binding SYLF domain-containing protein
MDMKRRNVIITGAGVAVLTLASAGCTTTSDVSGDPAARRKALDSSADSALSRLYAQHPGSTELINSARGVLVFPSVVSAGFLISGTHGQGVLRKGGKTAGYFSMTGGSVGLLAGAQSQAVFMLFMTDAALKGFETSSGWTAGADANITMITVGANARVTTQTGQQEVIGFVLTNSGLMGGVSLDGSRITRLSL